MVAVDGGHCQRVVVGVLFDRERVKSRLEHFEYSGVAEAVELHFVWEMELFSQPNPYFSEFRPMCLYVRRHHTLGYKEHVFLVVLDVLEAVDDVLGH